MEASTWSYGGKHKATKVVFSIANQSPSLHATGLAQPEEQFTAPK